MNPKLFLYILWCRKWLILFTLAATIAATAWFTSRTPKEYSAYTTVVLDIKGSSPFDEAGIPRAFVSGYLKTQADIITSRRVALRCLELLDEGSIARLARRYLGPAAESTLSPSELRERLAGTVSNTLTVDYSGESRVLDIWVTSLDPALSAEIANAFAQAYIDTSLALNVDPARRNAAWFDQQLSILRTRLEEKQHALTAYQADKGIVSIDERLDTEMRRLEELSSSLVDAQSETYNVRSRQLGPQHPEYIRALDRERSTEQLLERQKARVLEIRELRDELDLLLRDVDSARKAYDMALKQFYQNTLEGQFNQTNIAVLNEAAVPTAPSGPNLRLNLALATLLGLVFGCGLALAAELTMRRIRFEEDLADGIELKALATL